MQTINNILNIILLIGIVQGFIFNAVLFVKNKSNSKAIRFLNLTIFFFSLNNLQSLLVKKEVILHKLIQFFLIDISWNIFIAPMFFLFLIHYLRISKYYKLILPITTSIFLFSILLRFLVLLYNKPIDINKQTLFFRKYNTYEDILILAFTLIVFLLAVFVYQKAKVKFVSNFSAIKWINIFFVFTAAILFLWIIAIFLDLKYTNIKTANFYTPLRLGTSFLIYWLGYHGYNQYLLMQNRILLKKEIQRNAPIVIIDEDIDPYNKKEAQEFKELKRYILKNRLYLDPNFSLAILTEKVSKNGNYLSKLINTYSNYNFTDFINNYRVAYAKKILVNKQYVAYTIIAIGLECGFNSKSTFYTAFKKFTNQTPIQYRKNNMI